MSDAVDNGKAPATPIVRENGFAYHYGLTKREHFAAMAMQGLARNPSCVDRPQQTAKDAVLLADALLRALSAPPANEEGVDGRP